MKDKLKVLLVDDDKSFAKLVSIRLKNWNESIDIDTAHDVASARKLLDNDSVDYRLAILDNHLPDGSGYQIMDHSGLENAAVLSVSSDDAPELPAQNVRAGAHHFLEKRNISAPLFIPLVEAILERKRLEEQMKETAVKTARLETIKTLVATLRHEINNPLGAVIGAAYLLKHEGQLEETQVEAIKLIERSGNRINQVLQQLCEAAELEEVTKANERVFQVPGDEPWPEKKKLE